MNELVTKEQVNAGFLRGLQVGWYAFAGRKFSPKLSAFPCCMGVLAWINPDKNAPVGQRGLILTPERVWRAWSNVFCLTEVMGENDGKFNTQKLLAYGKEHKVSFWAADWCAKYNRHGVKKGEGFLPAKEQLEQIMANCNDINLSMEKINGRKVEGIIWSSSEFSVNQVWVLNMYQRCMELASKDYGCRYVRCLVAF